MNVPRIPSRVNDEVNERFDLRTRDWIEKNFIIAKDFNESLSNSSNSSRHLDRKISQ